jgi:hypothetical protein
MRSALLAVGALAALGLAACSKSDTSPTPEHNDVAAAMPDAASTPGAQGPATAAPHATPPAATTLSDTHPVQPNSAPAAPPPGTNTTHP